MRVLAVIFLLTGSVITTLSGWDFLVWGNTGHRVIGQVASKHLSQRATRKVKQLLGEEHLAEAATWADAIRSDKRYKKYNNWHYINYPFQQDYHLSRVERGALYQAIEKSISALKNPETAIEDQVFYLKMLVHLLGDLHQPMHLGKAEDKGGNTIQLRWFGKGSNLHAIWDSGMINKYHMPYKELADNIEKRSMYKIAELKKGDIYGWGEESRKLALQIYESVEKGDDLGYDYLNAHINMVEEQLFKAGVRLAVLLNEIY